ncbi:MAG: hypothetical protein IKU03_01435 [Bacteroidales bacterium]|nr:hypothetical protein [Bacteroidales bacterium]
MKKLFIYSSILILFFTGCEKEPAPGKDFVFEFVPSTLSWIEQATSDCCLQLVYGEENVENLEQEITSYFDDLFILHNFAMPSTDSISSSERYFYDLINNYFKQYAYQYDSLCTCMANVDTLIVQSSLDFEAKVRVTVYAYTFLGISNAFCTIYSTELKRQFPRDHYNNGEGDTHLQRQLSCCMEYQLDGHFETTLGSIAYVAGLPGSALLDLAICGEEILRGFWDHVN